MSPQASTTNQPNQADSPRLRAIWQALETVTDPEIPVLNVVDMGIIAQVRVEDRNVIISVTPTFVGCPAVDVIRQEILQVIQKLGEPAVEVQLVYDPPWTSHRLTEKGRRALKEFGLAPPLPGLIQIGIEQRIVPCPYCDSRDTDLESSFGPTLCRAIYYCRKCLQSFEQFKNV